MKRELRALDLCGGVGGWACAARDLPIRVAMAIDLDEGALTTYGLNHPDTWTVLADVRALPFAVEKMTGRFDVVLGGIPCEAICKWRDLTKRTRADETEITDWHTILDACLHLVPVLDPRWWCFEDVVPVIKHLPPLTPYQVLDSADFSGQRRRRAYVGQFPTPKPRRNQSRLADYLRAGPYRIGQRVLRRIPKRTHAWGSGIHSWWDPGRKAPTVCTVSSQRDPENVIVDGPLRRQVEWQEAALLQGFGADYVFYGSPTRVAKHIGQAIQIDTGRAILEAICREAFGGEKEPGLE